MSLVLKAYDAALDDDAVFPLGTSPGVPSNLTRVRLRFNRLNFHGHYSKVPQLNEACHQDEVHITERLMFKLVGNLSKRFYTLKGSNIPRVLSSQFSKYVLDPFPGETLSITLSTTWISIGLRSSQRNSSFDHERIASFA
ncbi:hypothetical protein Tco_1386030 [Tanacetum coccineum]